MSTTRTINANVDVGTWTLEDMADDISKFLSAEEFGALTEDEADALQALFVEAQHPLLLDALRQAMPRILRRRGAVGDLSIQMGDEMSEISIDVDVERDGQYDEDRSYEASGRIDGREVLNAACEIVKIDPQAVQAAARSIYEAHLLGKAA
jgi:hypothetical protein